MSVECHPICNLNPGGGSTQLRDRDYKVVAGITNPIPRKYSTFLSRLLDFNLEAKKQRCDEYIEYIKSSDYSRQLDGIKQLHDLVTQDLRLRNLDSGVVCLLVGFLKCHDKPELQFYSAGILPVVSPYEGELIKNEAVQPLLEILSKRGEDTELQVLSTLILLASGVPGSSEVLIRYGALELLEEIYKSVQDCLVEYMLVIGCTNFLTAICSGMPDSTTDKMKALAFSIGKSILVEWNVADICAQACSALSYLSYKRCVEIDQKTCEKLIWLMPRGKPSQAAPALEVVGNIVIWGNDEQIQVSRADSILVLDPYLAVNTDLPQLLIDTGLLKPLRNLLRHKYKPFRKEACKIIANILARKTWTEDVIVADLIGPVRILSEKDELDVKEEAIAAIYNAYFGDNPEHIGYLNRKLSTPLSKEEIESFLYAEVDPEIYCPAETYRPKNW